MTNANYRALRPWCDGEGMYPHIVRDACTLPEAEKSASLSPAFYIERLSDGAITSPCGEWLAEPVLGEAS